MGHIQTQKISQTLQYTKEWFVVMYTKFTREHSLCEVRINNINIKDGVSLKRPVPESGWQQQQHVADDGFFATRDISTDVA